MKGERLFFNDPGRRGVEADPNESGEWDELRGLE